MVKKIYLKIRPVSCTNTHHNATDLGNYGMIKNTKTWIYWEWNLMFGMEHNWLLSNCSRLLNWKGPETFPQSPKLSKRFQKNVSLAYIYQLTNWSKMHPVWCSNTHRDVTNFVNHGMAKNTKTWISWEWNLMFLQNKKILNLWLRWHILRGYCFAAEVK